MQETAGQIWLNFTTDLIATNNNKKKKFMQLEAECHLCKEKLKTWMSPCQIFHVKRKNWLRWNTIIKCYHKKQTHFTLQLPSVCDDQKRKKSFSELMWSWPHFQIFTFYVNSFFKIISIICMSVFRMIFFDTLKMPAGFKTADTE